MTPRSTWFWLALALALAGFVFFIEPKLRPPQFLPQPLLPGLVPGTVKAVLVQPAGGGDIRAEMTGGSWELTQPVPHPAIDAAPVALCDALAKLYPDSSLTETEVRVQTNSAAAFGLNPAQFAVTLFTPEARHQLLIGSRTAPGDQVFVQVVGHEGVHVVAADVLKLIPTNAAAWRDPALMSLKSLEFNRVSVTNGATTMELRFTASDQRWRMLRPRSQRADAAKFAALLSKLAKMQAREFVTDDPAADREALGLQPPLASISMGVDTNVNTLLHFGKSPTNDPKQVYARNDRFPGVMVVDKELLTPWLAPLNEFRDRKLLEFRVVPDVIEFSPIIRSNAPLVVSRAGNGGPDSGWIMAGDSVADAAAVGEIFAALTNATILAFAQDVVIDADLAKFGLGQPSRAITFSRVQKTEAGKTNVALLTLSFGAAKDGRIFVRRSDEDSVYEVAEEVVAKLPGEAFQLRDRRILDFKLDDVAAVTTTQAGRSRTLNRLGTNAWSIAAGSQGEIFSEAVEETVLRLGELSTLAWVALGATNLPVFGFDTNGITLEVSLRSGTKTAVSFGGPSASGYPCVAVERAGETWIGEIPIGVHYLVRTHFGLAGNSR